MRSDSEEEDHLSLVELARRLEGRKALLNQENANLRSKEIM